MDSIEILSFTLILLTALSYLPQVYSVYRSSAGIPVFATCLAALIAQGQFATFSLHGPLTWSDTQSILNLRQIDAQWIGACLCFILAARNPVRKIQAMMPPAELAAAGLEAPALELVEQDDEDTPVEVTIVRKTPSLYGRPVRTSVTILVMHLVTIFAAMAVAGQHNEFSHTLVTSIDDAAFRPLWTALSAVAPAFQMRHILYDGESTASFSKLTLSAQFFLFLGLAALWPFRVLPEASLWSETGLLLVWKWYSTGGWICLNNAIYALGQAGILFAILHRQNRSIAL